MDRREFLKMLGAGAAFLAGCNPQDSVRFTGGSFTKAKNFKPRTPNIIFIMTDDLGYGDVTCYNPESKIDTPNIDKLARQGIKFTDCHTPASVCTPTRYALLTGRYCWRSRLKRGVFGGYNPPLIENGRMSWAELMKRKGYGTACIGKWHIGMKWTTKDGSQPEGIDAYDQDNIDFTKPVTSGPLDEGFDYFLGTPGCATDDPPFVFVNSRHTVGLPEHYATEDPAEENRELRTVYEWHHEGVDVELLNRAVWFIEEHNHKYPDKPFFLYLPLSVPHIPWLPPSFTKGKSGAGPRGDQVLVADWAVQQIEKVLKKLDLREDTLLIFTSDNGPREGVNGHKSAGDLRGYKGTIWEGGHRVPFIARWPGYIEPASTSDETICLTDMMATCAAITGQKLPQETGEDSFNILPVLLGEKCDKPIREATIHHSGAGVFAIRKGHWKLIEGTKGAGYHEGAEDMSTGQLYDLKEDPAEQNDLWDERPDKVNELKALLDKYRERGHSRPV